MPAKTAEHYRNKIAIYLHWYQTRGFPVDIPDEQEKISAIAMFPHGAASARRC
jgi:predicted phosphoadenosine phosphosulfate sulfurtransferase